MHKLPETFQVIVFTLIISLSSGCAPVLVAAGASAGGAVIYDERSLDTIYHDAEITHQAHYNLKSDPDLKDQTHIQVSSFNTTVLMVGQVPNPELRAKAYKLVSEVHGVTRIHNELTLDRPSSTTTRSKDV